MIDSRFRFYCRIYEVGKTSRSPYSGRTTKNSLTKRSLSSSLLFFYCELNFTSAPRRFAPEDRGFRGQHLCINAGSFPDDCPSRDYCDDFPQNRILLLREAISSLLQFLSVLLDVWTWLMLRVIPSFPRVGRRRIRAASGENR